MAVGYRGTASQNENFKSDRTNAMYLLALKRAVTTLKQYIS